MMKFTTILVLSGMAATQLRGVARACGGAVDSHCISTLASSKGWNFKRWTRPSASLAAKAPWKVAEEIMGEGATAARHETGSNSASRKAIRVMEGRGKTAEPAAAQGKGNRRT